MRWRLAWKFGAALKINERIHECIRQARSALKTGRSFDFEPSLAQSATATTPEELIFWLHWLKARGHGAQLAAPNLGGEASIPAESSEYSRYIVRLAENLVV